MKQRGLVILLRFDQKRALKQLGECSDGIPTRLVFTKLFDDVAIRRVRRTRLAELGAEPLQLLLKFLSETLDRHIEILAKLSFRGISRFGNPPVLKESE